MLWRRTDGSGHEYARLDREESSWLLSGIALFDHDGLACRLDYSVRCDASWSTTDARVSGWVGKQEILITIAADGNGSWTLNGRACPEVRGCTDVDLNFSPSTNLLPIRRLELPVGSAAEVHAAWLRFPSFTLERLDQIYTRIGEHTYRYQSDGGFTAELQVDDAGFSTFYGDIWAGVGVKHAR